MTQITYRKLTAYKYQLMVTYLVATGVELDRDVRTVDDFVKVSTDGTMTLRKGYAWDGPSGPTIDTPSFMRGSLVHDGFYQLMRDSEIGLDRRDEVDRLLRQMCIEDGMSTSRANVGGLCSESPRAANLHG